MNQRIDPLLISCPECYAEVGERCKSLFLVTAFDEKRTPHASRILAITPRYVPTVWATEGDAP